MPLLNTTPDYKNFLLQKQGLDPYQYDMDDDGMVSPKVSSQPGVGYNSEPVPQDLSIPQAKPTTSIGGTLLHSAEASAIPTVTGLGFGALGAALAPATVGLSLAVPLAAGLIGGYVGEKLQQPLLSDAFKQQLQQEQEQNPVTSAIGGLIPSIAAFNPLKGLTELPGVAKSARKLALGRVGLSGLIDVEQAALANTGINMGVQGGINTAQQLISGQPFNVGQLGANVLGGAVLNSPNALGRRLFPHAYNTPQAKPLENIPSPINPSVANTTGSQDAKVFGAIPRGATVDEDGNVTYPTVENTATTPINSATIQSELFNKAHQYSPTPDEGQPDKFLDFLKAKQDLDSGKIALKEETQRIKEEASKLQDFMTQNQVPVSKPLDDAYIKNAAGEETSIPTKDYTGITEQDNTEVKNESPEDLAARQIEAKLARQNKPKYQEEPMQDWVRQEMIDRGLNPARILNDIDIQNKSVRDAINSDPTLNEIQKQNLLKTGHTEINPDNDPYLLRNTSSAYQNAVQQLAARRGITLKEAKGLINPATNKEVLGSYQPVNREANVNPNRAELDTPVHEVSHGYLGDLLDSAKPADRAIAQRGLDIFGGNRDQAEEALAGKLGVAGVSRVDEQIGGSALRNFNSWWNDYKSRMKLNLGMGSDEDVIRHLSARTFHDAPYGSRGELSYTGFQPGFAGKEGGRLYTANQDINDSEGKLLVKKGSTMSEHTLEKLSIKYQNDKSLLLKPTPISYNDLSPEDKKSYAKLHTDALTARVEHEKTEGANSDDLIDKELALKKFEDEKFGAMQYQKEPEQNLRMSIGDKSLPKEKSNIEEEYLQFPPTRSADDAVLKKDGPRAKPFINAITDNANQKLEDTARYKKMYNDATGNLNKQEKIKLEDTLLAENKDKKSYREDLSPKQQDAYNGLRSMMRTMQEDRIEANQPVKGYGADGKPMTRQAGIDPYYWPNQMNPEIIQEFHKGTTPASEHLREVWNEWQQKHGQTKEQASEGLDSVLGSYSKVVPNLAHFRGVDVEQGHGLPDEFMRRGLDRNMDRYINRFVSARAYHDTIESRPEVAKLIGEKTDPWGNDLPASTNDIKPLQSQEAKDIIKHLKGQDYNPEEGKLHGYSRVASSAILGPLTNLHILGSTIANALSFAKPSEVMGMAMHMVSDFNKGAQHALELGNITKRRQIFSALFDTHATQVEKLNTLADGIGRLNGRAKTDYIAKAAAQGMGEYLVKVRIPLAQTGDKQAIRFMKEVDKTWSPNKIYNEDEKIRLAGNFSNLLHGVHDSRTQPAWMLKDNIIQPFTSLMSWNIAQTNNFFKHVITPGVKDGNWAPLVMSTMGGLLGGYIIKKARETIANKKSPIPSFNEIANSKDGIEGNLSLDAYNLLGMASYAGYAGILSLGARSLFDLKYKNPPQGAVFPLDEVLTGSVNTIGHAASALMQSHDIDETTKIATHALADLFKNNVQGARIAMSWLDQSGALGAERERGKILNTEEADLRRYKMVQGLPYTEQGTDDANPYFNLNRKSYQHDLDIKDAANKLPDLISQAMDESGGNIEVLKSKLSVLKQGEYSSMPSVEHTPKLFWNYLNYLQRTQGNEEASKRLTEYIKNSAIDRAKASIVPSL